MKRVTMLLGFVACLALTGLANGAVVQVNFVFDRGPMTGQVGSAIYEVDGPIQGYYYPSTGYKSIETTVGGIHFTMSDEVNFPDYPYVGMNFNNVIHRFDYIGYVGEHPARLELLLFGDGTETNFVDFTPDLADAERSYGYITSFVVLSNNQPDGLGSFVPGAGGIGGLVFEPARPESPRTNRELAARAERYGVTVSELVRSVERVRSNVKSRTASDAKADGDQPKRP